MYLHAYVYIVCVNAYVYIPLACLSRTRHSLAGKMSSFFAMNLPLELQMEEH